MFYDHSGSLLYEFSYPAVHFVLFRGGGHTAPVVRVFAQSIEDGQGGSIVRLISSSKKGTDDAGGIYRFKDNRQGLRNEKGQRKQAGRQPGSLNVHHCEGVEGLCCRIYHSLQGPTTSGKSVI